MKPEDIEKKLTELYVKLEEVLSGQTAQAKLLSETIKTIEDLEGRITDGGGSDSDAGLVERVVNLEHLLGVQLPLRQIPGFKFKTSLPESASEEGRQAAAKKEAEINAAARLKSRVNS